MLKIKFCFKETEVLEVKLKIFNIFEHLKVFQLYQCLQFYEIFVLYLHSTLLIILYYYAKPSLSNTVLSIENCCCSRLK